MRITRLISYISGSRWKVSILSYFILLSIFVLDYLFIDYHENYTIFLIVIYLVPIFLMAECIKTTRVDVVAILVVSSLLWYFGDILKGHAHVNKYDDAWNAGIILLIYTGFVYVIFRTRTFRYQLQKQNEQLKYFYSVKNESLGIASHDIKNPLGVIYLSTEILLDKESREKLTAEHILLIEMIKKNATKITKLIQDQLNWSKLESGTINPKMEKMDYVKFIKGIVDNFNIAKRKNITIMVKCGYSEINALADRFHMEEVMNNLLENAIKFSYPNSIITVKMSKDDDSVLTEIIDKGVGIPANELQKIFKPFVRGSSIATGGENSTGLGLAIVDKIISEHGGKINVKSKLKEGSTFYFTLPLSIQSETRIIKSRSLSTDPSVRSAH